MQLTTIDPRSTRDLIRTDPVWSELERLNIPSLRSEADGWERVYSYGISYAEVDAAIAGLDRLLAGADEATIAKGLDYVAEVLGAKKLNARQVRGYVSLLTGIPAGLLPEALRRVCLMDAIHTMPTPGAIAGMVREEHAELKARRSRLWRMKTRMDVYNIRYRRNFTRPSSSSVERPAPRA